MEPDIDFSKFECSDCSFKDISWFSLNNGVILCDECAKVHYSLGYDTSRIYHKSHTKALPDSYKKLLEELLEKNVQGIWSENMTQSLTTNYYITKITPSSDFELRRNFIDFKYQKNGFVVPPSSMFEPDITIKKEIQNGNTLSVLKCIIQGCNLKQQDSKGDNLLHLAIRGKFIPVITLLYLWGVSLYDKNNTSQTPIDLANGSKNEEILYALTDIILEAPDTICLYLCNCIPDHKKGVHIYFPNPVSLGFSFNWNNLELLKYFESTSTPQFTFICDDLKQEIHRRISNYEAKEGGEHFDFAEILPLNPYFSCSRNEFRSELSNMTDYTLALFALNVLFVLSNNNNIKVFNEEEYQASGSTEPRPINRIFSGNKIFKNVPIVVEEVSDDSTLAVSSHLSKKIKIDRAISSIEKEEPKTLEIKIDKRKSDIYINSHGGSKSIKERWDFDFNQVSENLDRNIELLSRATEAMNIETSKQLIGTILNLAKSLVSYQLNSPYSDFKDQKLSGPFVKSLKNLSLAVKGKFNTSDEQKHICLSSIGEFKEEFNKFCKIINSLKNKS